MLCKPFYVGKLPYHIPNNWDITVDYKNGNVVVKEKCFAIQAVDKSIAQTRVWEKKYKLTGLGGEESNHEMTIRVPGGFDD